MLGGTGIFDVKFEGGVLKIPPLRVGIMNDSVLLNLVALEQCYYSCILYFAGYIRLMDCLIWDAKDVQILNENGIIDCRLSRDKEMAALFYKARGGGMHA